jgi:hypothetical protein
VVYKELYRFPLLENYTFVSSPIFYLYRIFLPPVQIIAFVPGGATMRYKWPLTGPRQGHLQPTRYKCLTFVPGGGSAWYKCEAGTFVPIGATARYKCEAICTGPCGGSAQTCNGYICFFFHLPEPPPPHSSSSLQLELPLPNGDLGSFCDDFSMILLISPRPRKLHRINGQINRTMCQGVTLHCVAVIAPISSNEDV